MFQIQLSSQILFQLFKYFPESLLIVLICPIASLPLLRSHVQVVVRRLLRIVGLWIRFQLEHFLKQSI